jgi:hypothetical protein
MPPVNLIRMVELRSVCDVYDHYLYEKPAMTTSKNTIIIYLLLLIII